MVVLFGSLYDVVVCVLCDWLVEFVMMCVLSGFGVLFVMLLCV